jgi:hypothetical protein
MDLTFTQHAADQIRRRGILIGWIEDAIESPDQVETSSGKTCFLKCHGDRKKMLRVVTRAEDHSFIITVYFDRRMPC